MFGDVAGPGEAEAASQAQSPEAKVSQASHKDFRGVTTWETESSQE